MKIGVLTQPLGENYGGILQNWALQQVLTKLGHEPITIRYEKTNISILIRLKRYIRSLTAYCIKYIIRHPNLSISNLPWQNKPNDNLISFVKHNIRTLRCIRKVCYKTLLRKDIGLIIVGSDQVWRPKYNTGFLDLMFCEFLPDNSIIPAITYGCSFGTSFWEYTVEETNRYKRSVRKFKFVSTREKSAKELCRSYFEINAQHVLDPTLLLSSQEYRNLYANNKFMKHEDTHNKVAVYILDLNEDKRNLVENICNQLNKRPVYIGTHSKDIYERPTVESWLKSIDESAYVITDSFHGTVFSLIFHKPFISIVNQGRGADRFISLLETFDLTDKIVYDKNDDLSSIKISSFIDWNQLEKIKKVESEASIEYLNQAIKSVFENTCRFPLER